MVTLTKLAKEHLKSEANDGFVTLGIKSGGCNGFEYCGELQTRIIVSNHA